MFVPYGPSRVWVAVNVAAIIAAIIAGISAEEFTLISTDYSD